MLAIGLSTAWLEPMQDVQCNDPKDSENSNTYITNNYLQPKKPVKVPLLDPFHGDHAKLKQFLIQVNLYIAFNCKKFKLDCNKAMWMSLLLKGMAFNWIEMYIKDYLKNYLSNNNCWNNKTQKLFNNFKTFKACLEMMFRDIKQERTIEQVLF